MNELATTTEAVTRYQAGEITATELAAILEAANRAQVEADNIARHGTANSVQIFADIRTDLIDTK